MKLIGLALHNYHETHQCFPSPVGGVENDQKPSTSGDFDRLSGIVALLPYLDQSLLFDRIASPLEADGVTYPPMGPAPWVQEYPPWQKQIRTLECPNSRVENRPFGRTNYAFCIGDVVERIHQPDGRRGLFTHGRLTSLEKVRDGTSQTIAMGEIGDSDHSLARQIASGHTLRNPGRCLDTVDGREYRGEIALLNVERGERWADGAAAISLFNTVLPPNSPSCAFGQSETADGIYSVGSGHEGGAHVLLADGSVHFISESIDAGDPTRPAPSASQIGASPYGTWGALGTLAADDELERGW